MENLKDSNGKIEWVQGCTELKSISDAAGVAALISALAKVERTYGADQDDKFRRLSSVAFKRLNALLENLDVNDYVGLGGTKS